MSSAFPFRKESLTENSGQLHLGMCNSYSSGTACVSLFYILLIYCFKVDVTAWSETKVCFHCFQSRKTKQKRKSTSTPLRIRNMRNQAPSLLAILIYYKGL